MSIDYLFLSVDSRISPIFVFRRYWMSNLEIKKKTLLKHPNSTFLCLMLLKKTGNQSKSVLVKRLTIFLYTLSVYPITIYFCFRPMVLHNFSFFLLFYEHNKKAKIKQIKNIFEESCEKCIVEEVFFTNYSCCSKKKTIIFF